MNQEDITTDAPVKPAKMRAPRKSTRSKAPAAASEGDAATPAASPAPDKTSKPRAPRRRKETPPAAEPAAPAPEASPAAETPATASPEKARPERRRKKSPAQSAPAPESAPVSQPQPPATEQKEQVRFTGNEIDIPEPPTEFRKPEPVPGFAMPEVVGGNEGGGNNRRKRRRNRNRNREDNNREPQQNQLSPRVDPEELTRRAWKIFLGEVTEDGLAFMDDRTAAEASRRAFKVAEIFLLEAARHRPEPETSSAAEVSAQVLPETSSDKAE